MDGQLWLAAFIVLVLGVASALLWEAALRAAISKGRVKLATARPRALSEREIRVALRVDEQDPLWVAMHQLLAGMIADAHEEATDADNQLQPPLPSYYAGAAKHLERFRDFLLTERAKALEEELSAD